MFTDRLQRSPLHQGWRIPSDSVVYRTVRATDPALIMMAHHGTKAYREQFDLLHRREATQPNEIWQADHTLLDIWVLDDKTGVPIRPWLTVVIDDHSRMVAGYYLGTQAPSALVTSLALRQAIWRKEEANWPICGIPDIFYTDHGADFTSHHMEQVSADIKMQLVFSAVGMPRGRGRIERFFKTVNQLFLNAQPGYAPAGSEMVRQPVLTLGALQTRFHTFLLNDYHQRLNAGIRETPLGRWQRNGFLPRLPDSLEQLDLLLLCVASARKVRRDGLRLFGNRYIDATLSAFVGERVTVRYDPRDMSEVRLFDAQDRFICRAICQELAGEVVPLRAIIAARDARRRAVRGQLKDHAACVRQYVEVHHTPAAPRTDAPPQTTRLKRYFND